MAARERSCVVPRFCEFQFDAIAACHRLPVPPLFPKSLPRHLSASSATILCHHCNLPGQSFLTHAPDWWARSSARNSWMSHSIVKKNFLNVFLIFLWYSHRIGNLTGNLPACVNTVFRQYAARFILWMSVLVRQILSDSGQNQCAMD